MELQLRREPDLDPAPEGDPGPLRDEQLRLIFLCCHPALAPRAQITLTLRLVVGLTPSAIEAVLFESDAATTKRLVRARAKIRDAVIPFRMPGETELEVRLRPVRAVLYLVYTEGHTASSGPELGRVDRCVEAIRLARLVSSLRPDEPEVQGRLALLLLYDRLVEHQPSPVVHLHRAVARARGPPSLARRARRAPRASRPGRRRGRRDRPRAPARPQRRRASPPPRPAVGARRAAPPGA